MDKKEDKLKVRIHYPLTIKQKNFLQHSKSKYHE